MAYPLSFFSEMPEALIGALRRANVMDSDGLLAAGRLPHQRDALAVVVGADAADLDVWVSVADLVRLSTLTPQCAELIVRSGVAHSVQELGAMAEWLPSKGFATGLLTHIRDDAVTAAVAFDGALRRLRDYAAQRSWASRVPWPEDLARAVEEAANLSPRLVVRTDGRSVTEQARLQALVEATSRHHKRSTLITLLAGGVLTGFCVIFLAFAFRIVINREVAALESLLPEAARLAAAQVGRALGWSVASANIVGLGIFIIGIVAYVAAMSLVANTAYRAWRLFGIRLVLTDVAARREYVLHAEEEARHGPYFIRTTLLFGGVSLALVAIIMATPTRIILPNAPFEEALAANLALLVVPAALVLFWPSLRYLVRRYRSAPPAHARVVRTFVVFRLGELATSILLVIAFVLLLAPANAGASHLAHRVSEPWVDQARKLASARFDELARPGDPGALGSIEGGEALADSFTSRLNALESALASVSSDIPDVLRVFVRTLLPSLLLVLLLAIVVPFLLLGGWLRGVFFFVLLVAISFTEMGAQNLISQSFTPVFGIAAGSHAFLALVGFTVFTNAILFEWVFEFTLERRPTCVACSGSIDRGARFCSHCGVEQA